MFGTGALLTILGGFSLLVATPFTLSAATCGTHCGQHHVSLWPRMVACGVLAAPRCAFSSDQVEGCA